MEILQNQYETTSNQMDDHRMQATVAPVASFAFDGSYGTGTFIGFLLLMIAYHLLMQGHHKRASGHRNDHPHTHKNNES